MLAERGDIVDQATDILERMLDDVVAVAPTDDKGRAIVPQWEADYRTYLEDRRAFADGLRPGENEPFTETAVDGIPISEKLDRFAGDNEMPACAPDPRPTSRHLAPRRLRRMRPSGCHLAGTRRVAGGDAVVGDLAAHDAVGADHDVAADRGARAARPCRGRATSHRRCAPAARASPAPRSAGRGRRSRGSGR